MKRNHPLKHNSRKTSRQSFLYRAASPDPHKHAEKKRPAIGIQQLSARFPEMTLGKQCIEEALKFLESFVMFGVMLIRLENFEELLDDQEKALDRLVRTAEAVSTVCRENEGVWGMIEQDLFGCFFPELESLACESLAESFRSKLESRQEKSLTIGIAEYPLANFDRIGAIDNARKALEHAALEGTDRTAVFNAVSLNISGDRCYQEGDIEGAVGEFKAALVLDPSNVNVRNSLGVCYSALNAFDSALKEFETASQIAPDAVLPVYNTGLAYMLSGNDEKALIYFKTAVSMDEERFEAVFQTSVLYLKKERYDKAASYLKEAVRIQPDAGRVHRLLGECHEARSKDKEAYTAYRQAVRCNPNDAAALSALGLMADRNGEGHDIALLFCRHSVELAPDNGLYHQRLGRLYHKYGMDDKALESFKQAEQLGCPCDKDIRKISINNQKDNR